MFIGNAEFGNGLRIDSNIDADGHPQFVLSIRDHAGVILRDQDARVFIGFVEQVSNVSERVLYQRDLEEGNYE